MGIYGAPAILQRFYFDYDIIFIFINPTIALSNYSQEQVMQYNLGHYTDFGLNEISNYINNYFKYLY
jgi:hypothetical protein